MIPDLVYRSLLSWQDVGCVFSKHRTVFLRKAGSWAASCCLLVPSMIVSGGKSEAAQNAVGAFARAAPSDKVIELQYDPPLLPYLSVHLRINGSAPLRFVVDTGANAPLLILPWAADRLRLERQEEMWIDINQTREAAKIAPLHSLQMLGISKKSLFDFDPPKAIVAPVARLDSMSGSERIAGIVGLPMLGPYGVRFDMDAGTMTLFGQEIPSMLATGESSVPMKSGRSGLLLVAIGLPGSDDRIFILDTGRPRTELPYAFGDEIASIASLLEPTSQPSYDHVHSVTMLLPEITLGSLKAPNVEVTTSATSTPLLGLNLLSRYRFTLDLVHPRLILHKGTISAARSRTQGAYEIDLVQTQGSSRVASVRPGSNAEQSGLKAGDRILAIDGKPLRSLGPSLINALLCGYADTPATLLVVRSTGETIVHYLRTSRFAGNGKAGIGLEVSRHEDRSVWVTRVTLKSSAQEAGVKVDSEIVSVDGLVCRTISMKALFDKIHKGEGEWVTLVIKHGNETEPKTVRLKVSRSEAAN